MKFEFGIKMNLLISLLLAVGAIEGLVSISDAVIEDHYIEPIMNVDDFVFNTESPNFTLNHLTWNQYKALYNRKYGFFENLKREAAYYLSRFHIIEQVKRYDNQESKFYSQSNGFLDWVEDEKTDLGGLLLLSSIKNVCNGSIYYGDTLKDKYPEPVNWVNEGYVSNVEHQVHCASDYAFSVIGAVESHIAKRKKTSVVPLSVQQVLDCSNSFGNRACFGGSVNSVYNYLASGVKLNTKSSYPFIGINQKCINDLNEAMADEIISGCKLVSPGDEEALASALVNEGPISVGIVMNEDLFFYKGGIYSNPACIGREVNHAMLLVGYGTDIDTGLNYWLLKNSWGKDWGYQGYMKLLKDNTNHCGIASMATFPTFKDTNNF